MQIQDMFLYTFLLTIIFRMISGFQNGEYYNKYVLGVWTSTIIMVVIVGVYAMAVDKTVLITLGPLAVLVGVMSQNRDNRIHIWENMTQAAWVISGALFGADLIALILGSLFTGNFLFNMMIQWETWGKWDAILRKNYYKKTELIEIWNIRINKPRLFTNGRTECAMAIVVALLCMLNYFFGWVGLCFDLKDFTSTIVWMGERVVL